MQRYDFHHWLTMQKVLKDSNKAYRTKNYVELCSILQARFEALHRAGDVTDQDHRMNLSSTIVEEEWFRCGCPYFKVWPRMAAELTTVRLDIGGEYLKAPFPVYVVRLPTKDNPLQEENGPELKAMQVRYTQDPDLLAKRKDHCIGYLSIRYQFNADVDANWMGWSFNMPLYAGQAIEQEVIETHTRASTEYSDGYTPSLELLQAITRIAIAVAFFGTNQHDIVMPDLPRKLIDKYYAAKQANNENEAAKLIDQAKKEGMYGYKVGSEIDLPTPLVRYHGVKEATEETNRHLEYGHIRKAHLCMQPCGEGGKQRKLIFRRHALVRPDLPFQEAHGYRIRHSQ